MAKMTVDNEKVKAEATMAVGSMISLVTAVIASPAEAVTNYVSGEDRKASYQLIGVEAVSIAVMGVIYRLLYNLFHSGTPFPANRILNYCLRDLFAVLVVMGAGALLIPILAKKEGIDVNFNKALSIASLQAIVMTPAYIVYYLVSGFDISVLTGLAGVLVSGAQALAVILTFYGFSVVIKDKRKLFYGIGIYFTCLLLVNWIIGRLF